QHSRRFEHPLDCSEYVSISAHSPYPACINNAGWNKRDGYYENNINTGFYISRFCERKRGVESFKYISRLKIAIDI
ncbi:TPA: hypothetical protein ACV5T7_004453, partial [Salmonella enterica]